VSIKSLPASSFYLLYFAIMTPINKFIKKKLPITTDATKKTAATGFYISEDAK
jgi:hypothetical protein